MGENFGFWGRDSVVALKVRRIYLYKILLGVSGKWKISGEHLSCRALVLLVWNIGAFMV